MSRAIFLMKTSVKTPVMDSIKEFIKEEHPLEYDKFEKFNDWHRCTIKSNTVSKWISRLKDKGTFKCQFSKI
jgi:hypothetical protein